MKIREIADILSAEFLTEDDPDIDIRSACGSDMMSDVLACERSDGAAVGADQRARHPYRRNAGRELHCLLQGK